MFWGITSAACLAGTLVLATQGNEVAQATVGGAVFIIGVVSGAIAIIKMF